MGRRPWETVQDALHRQAQGAKNVGVRVFVVAVWVVPVAAALWFLLQ